MGRRITLVRLMSIAVAPDAALLSNETSAMYMEPLSEHVVICPYCGEDIDVLIDQQEQGQQYIEDCQVCCKPITFCVAADAMGNLSVSVRDENETY